MQPFLPCALVLLALPVAPSVSVGQGTDREIDRETSADEARQAAGGPQDLVPPESATLATPLVRVPFRLAKSRPVPVVEAMVEGRGPYRFFLDTGASVCVFDTAFVEELGLEHRGTTEIGDPSDSARIPAQRAWVNELVLGGLTARGIEVVAFDRSSFTGGEDIKGVLGLPLFMRLLFTLDYAGEEVRLREGALEPDQPHVVPFELEILPRLYVDVGGTILWTTIDSGSPAGLTLPHSFAAGLAFLEPLALVGRGRTVNSEFSIHGGRLDGTVRLAGHELVDPYVTTTDLLEHVNLGYGVLRHFALTIDMARHLIAFERVEGEGALRIEPESAASPVAAGSGKAAGASKGERRRLGAQLAAEPDGLRVAMVVPGSEAERAGLQADDRIVRLNGEELAGRGPEPLGAALFGGEPIAIGVLRAGEALEIVLFPRSDGPG